MIKSPCYHCPDKVMGCHSTCVEYNQFVSDKQDENNMIRKKRAENSLTWGTATWTDSQRRDWRRKCTRK